MATKLNPDAIQDRSIASIKLQDGVIPSESTVSGWGFTKNAGTITGITMNGASKGTSGVVNLGTVITDVSGKADSSAAIGTLSLSINSSNYQITLSGTKVDGTTFTVSDVIDLPLESVVVNGSYDDTTQKVILTLKNGSTIDFSIADLIDGLQSEITSTNKLSADLIEDGTTNKTVTATEKQTWNSYANVQADWNESTTTEDDFILNKPAIKAGTGTNSIIGGNLDYNIASAGTAISIGEHTIASGQATLATGFMTKADSASAFSTGTGTYALGQASFSSGTKTAALGNYSHAEGIGDTNNSTFTVSGAADTTTYTTNTAHNLKINDVVGYGVFPNLYVSKVTGVSNDGLSFNVNKTLSSTALSNATIRIFEGGTALGNQSHTEGNNTVTIGNYSHAEGNSTKAVGSGSHAEGGSTVTNGISSHAEGIRTTTNGNYSHAEGQGTITENQYEHAQGNYNKSNIVDQYNFGNAGNTISSIGIGTSGSARKNAVEVMQNGDVYVYGVGDYDGTNPTTADTLQDAINNASMDLATPITYSALVTLKTGGNLVPGMQYRITDYTCTTTQTDTQSAGHVFDIIVTADSETELNENARAAHHSGDTYFANCDLDAWELKYCLENDTNRFYWADTTNGKGVIYYMKDEWNNECPYDFKNIQFKRYKVTSCTKSQSLVGKYSISGITGVTVNKNNILWSYTFCVIDTNDNNTPHDVSVEQRLYSIAETSYCNTANNILKPYYNSYQINDIFFDIMTLPNNVFVTDTSIISSNYFFGYLNNYLDNYCQNNSFGNSCGQINFGIASKNNLLGDFCADILLFGNNNLFGDECSGNLLRGSCWNNSFGYSCMHNILENSSNNSFGDYFSNNSIKLSSYNTFGNYCIHNIIEGNVQYCNITGGTSNSASIKNTKILSGTKGTSSSNQLTITFEDGKDYTQVAGLVNGTTLRIWIAEDTVTGPSTSTGNNLAAFDGTTGKVIKDSGVALSSLYTKPSTGIPSTDLAQSVQTSLGLADTALQSYTETDPVFTASVAHGITSNDITNWNNKTSNVGTITGITMNGASKGTSGVVNLGTVITSETALSKGTTTGNGNAVTDISVSGHEITLTKGTTFLTQETDPVFGSSAAASITDSQINQWDAKVSANNGILTIQKNGTQVATFSANQTTNQTANIQVNELPSVSASDNGKILMVVNGAWSLVTPVSIYSGTSTPDSSLGDNGDLYIQTNS